jgi:dUTP pyrophosphatase
MENSEENHIQKILEQFQRVQEIAGETPDEEYQKQLDELIKDTFGGMDEEIIKMHKTKTLKVKKLHPDAILPKYNYQTDSGFDLHSVEDITIPPFGRAFVPTGLSFQFDENYEIQVRTKSGLAIKQGLMVLNSPGTVDQGYSGEIKAIIFNVNNESVTIPKGMKVAQAVLCPVVNGGYVNILEVNQLEETDRGSNGFGSTGIN